MELFKQTKGIVCQQVNCCGVMGTGLAKEILEQYPQVKKAFDDNYKNTINEKNANYKCHFNQLGTYELIALDINNPLYVANIYSQDNYGNPSKIGKVYTKIDKLIECIKDIAEKNKDLPIYIPHIKNFESKEDYGIGCGYGGESWERVEKAICDLNLPNIYELDTKTGQVGRQLNKTINEIKKEPANFNKFANVKMINR